MKKKYTKKHPDVYTGALTDQKVLAEKIQEEIESSTSIDLIVSFLKLSGVRLILPELKLAAKQGKKIRILTGCYLNITEPSALFTLKKELGDSLDLRLFNETKHSFHPKAYFFHKPDQQTDIILGSSNLSSSALINGIEWNVLLHSDELNEEINSFKNAFEELFNNHSVIATDETLKEYSRQYGKKKSSAISSFEIKKPVSTSQKIEPNEAQAEALYFLDKSRKDGNSKGLVVAATGVGKTYLAAFDAQNFNKILFVAHRDEILEQAEKTFKNVLQTDDIGYFKGSSKDADHRIVFASIATLSKPNYLNPGYFKPDEFDYIIIDEAHHTAAQSYKRVLEYFKPKYLLGITATPERMDEKSIYELLDYNVVYEINLYDAINRELLAPFRYYGIYDETDYSGLTLRLGRYSQDELTRLFKKPEVQAKRFELIFKHYQKYSPNRAIGFCASIDHAIQMEGEFSNRGVKATAISSRDSKTDREKKLSDFRSGKINLLLTVDLFNEGVDIPEIDLVMFMRPTESSTVFLQQLGRGLRKSDGKSHLTILDFIGNYKNALRIPSYFALDKQPGMIPTIHDLTKGEGLPEGCLVDFDMESIDLIETIRKRVSGLTIEQEAISEYRRIKEDLGSRPSRTEFYQNLRDDLRPQTRNFIKSRILKNYLQFLDKQGDLSSEEKEIKNTIAGDFLNLIETTSMTRSYKIPVLMSFISGQKLKDGVTFPELLSTWEEFYNQNNNWKDLFKSNRKNNSKAFSFSDFLNLTPNKHIQNIKKNPIHFLEESGRGFFKMDGDRFVIDSSLTGYMDKPAFINNYRDILNYRSREYYRERYLSE